MSSSLLGLTLEEALHRLGEDGSSIDILRTEPARGRSEGELRVVRASNQAITVAPFRTEVPIPGDSVTHTV